MADVFISYSRRDIAFARILHEAIKENALEPWIDWQDIPPSTEWLAEVYEAIEKADTFVFLISQTSVESEVCGMEVAHAIKNNKRLIPVVINEVEPQRVMPELAALNWLLFQNEDDYGQVLQDLITAIQTDYAWVKEHTRLQVRALEWEKHNFEGGYLLRGGDLEQAERWLAQSGEKQTQPTALQTQYLLASRRAATRRQQVTMGAVLMGLLIAVILGVVAWNQRNEALTQSSMRATSQVQAEVASTQAIAESWQRGTAESQAVTESHQRATAEADALNRASIALSRQLANATLLQLDNDQELALLLAIEAARAAETSEANESLRRALVHPGRTLHLLLGHTGDVYCAHWDPGGNRILSASEDGTARIWDAASGETLNILRGHTGAVVSAIWDFEGKQIATAGVDGTARIWNAADGKVLKFITAHEGIINVIAWSPDGSKLLTAGEDGTARVWDAASGEKLVDFSAHGESVTHAAWNKDGSLIVTGSIKVARIWDANSGAERMVIPSLSFYGARLSFVAWSHNSSKIMTGGLEHVHVWDIPEDITFSGNVIELVDSIYHAHNVPGMLNSEITHASWNSENNHILSVSGTGTAEIWNAENGVTSAVLQGHTARVNTGVWSPDGTMAATASDDGTARLWDTSTGFEVAKLTGHQGSVHQVAWDPSGKYVATASSDGTIRIWAVAAVDLITELSLGPQDFSSWSPDGKMLITGPYDSTVWDVSSGEVLNKLEGSISWNPAGHELLTTNDDGSIQLWDVDEFLRTKGEGIAFISLPGDSGLWSPDGSKVITTLEGEPVRIWDASSGEELVALALSSSPRLELVWSPDGTRIASIDTSISGGKREYLLQVWDAGTGEKSLEFPVFSGQKLQISWNPGSTQLVTVGYSETAQVWNVDKGDLYLELVNQKGRVNFAAWSPDGTRLLTALSGTVSVWDTNTGKILSVMSGHVGAVWHAAWSIDGTAIATTSDDATARIWDAHSGSQLAVIGGYFDVVTTANWSPDGSRLVVTSWGGPVRVFDVPLVRMLETACSRTVRNMSLSEWDKEMGEIPYRETCPGKPIPEN